MGFLFVGKELLTITSWKDAGCGRPMRAFHGDPVRIRDLWTLPN